ncbi:MAG TPA: hypothetical protein ENJ33_07210 [Thiothrix sp.]|nr:hypothetical protein [Thiothrix sp.]
MKAINTPFVKVTVKNMAKTMLLLCLFGLASLSPQAFADEQTKANEKPLVRGIIFTNTQTAATAVTTSAYQDDIEAWYEANLFKNNTPASQINIATTNQTTKTSNGNACHLTRSIVMLGNSGEGTAITSSQVNINEHCPQ